MVDQSLAAYVRDRLREGYTEEGIRTALLQGGHPSADIEGAIGAARRPPGGHHALLIVLLLVVVGVVAFLLLRPDSDPTGGGSGSGSGSGTGTGGSGSGTGSTGPPSTGALSLAEELQKTARSGSLTPDEVYYETVRAARANAANVADGILFCSVNEEHLYKNYCLQEMAEERRDAAYCAFIGDIKQRDDCYLALIFAGEDQYCAELILDESKGVCDILLGEL